MGQKQTLTRTQIAKMSGHENTQFLTRAQSVSPSRLVTLAGCNISGFT